MGRAAKPSIVTLPQCDKPYPDLISFLIKRFPKVPELIWRDRIARGVMRYEDGDVVSGMTPYIPRKRLFYYREIENEPVIPFKEEIIFQNEDLLVACKPHFLPVIPGGRFVSECLLDRLYRITGCEDITPIHRIDRETAGLVMFSLNKETRGAYQLLFENDLVDKTYHAIAECHDIADQAHWTVENCIAKGEPWFRMTIIDGDSNSHSKISLIEQKGGKALFKLRPVTGKKHQLRLHMASLGYPICNDPYYPDLQSESDDDFEKPLQLLAHSLQFVDPLTGETVLLQSTRSLVF